MVRLEVYKLKSIFYHGMATAIRRTWRGYFSRKTIHDFYALKRYLLGVEARNEEMRSRLSEEKEKDDRRRLEEEAALAHRRLVMEAKSKHHLISTHAIPGVFNNPYKVNPEAMEFRLKAITPMLATERMREDNQKRISRKKTRKERAEASVFARETTRPFQGTESCVHSAP